VSVAPQTPHSTAGSSNRSRGHTLGLVVGRGVVARVTGVIRLTATEPERDHVDGVVPVGTQRVSGSTASPGAGPRTGRQSRARSSCAGRQ